MRGFGSFLENLQISYKEDEKNMVEIWHKIIELRIKQHLRKKVVQPLPLTPVQVRNPKKVPVLGSEHSMTKKSAACIRCSILGAMSYLE